MEFLAMIADRPVRLILSNPLGEYRKSEIRKVAGPPDFYQCARYNEKQVFHVNFSPDKLHEFLMHEFSHYRQIDAWGEQYVWNIKRTKKGKLLVSKRANEVNVEVKGHNRQKSYILEDKTVVPALVDLKIMDAQGNVLPSRYAKFKQINRFLEMIEDVIEKEDKKQWNIVDFGCGKSYLTFIVYDYLTRIRKLDVSMVGLDLKADVISACNLTAQKYGYDRLSFQLGDIKDFKSDRDIDMVISLHACDIATDYAINQAIRWNAKIILTVPCCHKELLHFGDFSDVAMIGAYGLSKERISALMTDNYRAAYLEKMGYSVDLLEMFDLSHSPKNILIRAVKGDRKQSQKSKDVITQIEGQLKVKLTLGRLLEGE
jgi:hypothetical protein